MHNPDLTRASQLKPSLEAIRRQTKEWGLARLTSALFDVVSIAKRTMLRQGIQTESLSSVQ